MKLTDFKALTFDCYGTLIDWESGIWDGLQPLLTGLGKTILREQALADYGEEEHAQELATPSLKYSELLARVHQRLAKRWGAKADAALDKDFGAFVPYWPAFPDSADALRYLKQHYKLVILSNVDRQSFNGSNRRLGVAFDAIYTAEDIGSYKPDPRNFEYLLAHVKSDLGLDRSAILHTAQSLFHDHVPAERAGLARAWINRRKGKTGSGATKIPERMPKLHFEHASLGELAEAHRRETGA